MQVDEIVRGYDAGIVEHGFIKLPTVVRDGVSYRPSINYVGKERVVSYDGADVEKRSDYSLNDALVELSYDFRHNKILLVA